MQGCGGSLTGVEAMWRGWCVWCGSDECGGGVCGAAAVSSLCSNCIGRTRRRRAASTSSSEWCSPIALISWRSDRAVH